jgi:glyoxylate reductase
MDNVSLLPHVGTENQDARRKMEVVAITNIRDFLLKGKGEQLIPELK